jgi:hypothetical protein
MSYALVQDNIVVGTQNVLPPIWKNITGFNLLSDAEVAEFGFLPVIDTAPSYDPTSQTISAPAYEIGSTQVVANYTVTPLTSAQVAGAVSTAQTEQLLQLQTIKQARLAAMKYVFGSTTYFVTLGTQDQIDIQTRLQQLAAAPAGTTIAWEIIDNVFVTFTLADLQALYSAALTYINAVYANTQSLIAQVNACTTLAALSALNLTAGWP